MNNIKRYNNYIKESVESETFQDICEICYDLTDYGKFKIDIKRVTSDEDYTIIILARKGANNGILLKDVIEYVERIKNYLGKRYKDSSGYNSTTGEWIRLKKILNNNRFNTIQISFNMYKEYNWRRTL